MKVHAYRDGDGTTVVVGQQDIDVAVPPGGVIELLPGGRPDFVKLTVLDAAAKPKVLYLLDERDVPRPVTVSHQL